VPAHLINIKYITIRAEKVASPVAALQMAWKELGVFACSQYIFYGTSVKINGPLCWAYCYCMHFDN